MASPTPTTPNLQASDLKSYENAAAGHEGVMSDASGALVIKPCTAAEIAFYETAPMHPAFAALIPTYMGTLTLNSNNNPAPPSDVSSAATPNLPSLTSAIASSSGSANTGGSLAVPTPGDAKSGAWTPSGGHAIQTTSSIVLSNATYGFKKPNVLDVKLGARLWDEAAPKEKRIRLDEVAAETTSGSLGFRIAGMRVWQGPGSSKSAKRHDVNYKVFDKYYGRNFSAANVKNGFKEFLLVKNAGVTPKLARTVTRAFAAKVKEIHDILKGQESRMYSASMLFVYEGDGKTLENLIVEEEKARAKQADRGQKEKDGDYVIVNEDDDADAESDDSDEIPNEWYDVKLIDFAHASWTPGQGPDLNALQGVESTYKILEELADADEDAWCRDEC